MATQFSNSIIAVCFIIGAGCGRKPHPKPTKMLLYCSQPAKPYAKKLTSTMAEASGLEVILAPMSGKDMLVGLEGTRAGDFAVVLSPSLQTQLAKRRLAVSTTVLQELTVCLVSREPMELDDLSRTGLRLGSGNPRGPLGEAVSAALPDALLQAVDANTLHRSERSDELLRMLKLDALDAVFVWDSPPPPAEFHIQELQGPKAQCDVVLIELACSRLEEPDRKRLMGLCAGALRPSAEGASK